MKAYDSPYFAIADLDGMRRGSRAARNLGYDGRTVIHPSHLEIVNEIFAPTQEQIAGAERIVAAMAAAHTEGRGVATLDGQMIDQVHLSAAKKTLSRAGGNHGK